MANICKSWADKLVNKLIGESGDDGGIYPDETTDDLFPDEISPDEIAKHAILKVPGEKTRQMGQKIHDAILKRLPSLFSSRSEPSRVSSATRFLFTILHREGLTSEKVREEVLSGLYEAGAIPLLVRQIPGGDTVAGLVKVLTSENGQMYFVWADVSPEEDLDPHKPRFEFHFRNYAAINAT